MLYFFFYNKGGVISVNKKFNLYCIKEEYIEYLRKFDSRVAYNKNQTRPYVGIVCIYKGQKYFVPMSSPKEKHLKLNPNLADIYKIDNGKLGILNINNMIPATMSVIEKIDFSKQEKSYAKLLSEQLLFLNNNREELLFKISKFFVLYDKNKLYENIRARTCDFYLLEIKCKEWERTHNNCIKEDNDVYNVNNNDYRVFPY